MTGATLERHCLKKEMIFFTSTTYTLNISSNPIFRFQAHSESHSSKNSFAVYQHCFYCLAVLQYQFLNI